MSEKQLLINNKLFIFNAGVMHDFSQVLLGSIPVNRRLHLESVAADI